jgi:hypothetical protein
MSEHAIIIPGTVHGFLEGDVRVFVYDSTTLPPTKTELDRSAFTLDPVTRDVTVRCAPGQWLRLVFGTAADAVPC